MKLFIKSFVVWTLLMGSAYATSIAQLYTEGVHYDVIEAPKTSQPEVREYFSFFCSHCYNYERLAKALKPNIPDGVFIRSHVDSLGMATQIDQVRLTKALVILQNEGGEIEDKGVAAFFDIIHRQRQKDALVTDQSIKEILVTVGIDRARLDVLWTSQETSAALADMVSLQEDLFNRKQLEGVPSVVVNGKYRINHQGLSQKDVVNDYTGLLNYLLSK